MIQFNLLPDVKLEYIKTRRTKRMVISVALIASGVALCIFLLLLVTVDFFQKKNISDLSDDIKTNASKLENTKDINKILTIQNQLIQLPKMHDDKAVASRTFGFIQQITPSQATISDLKIDYNAHTISIVGAAPSLTVVNTFTDTLKFTKYLTADGTSKNLPAFSSVVLSSFSRDSNAAHFTITANYDQNIFTNTTNVTLTVPDISTTRSEIDQPGIFSADTTSTTNTAGQ
jgi:hypothetical protein